MKNNDKDKTGLMSGVFMAYFILILHVILIAGLGCLVLFFRGFVQYMLWIFLAGTALISYSGYRFYKRMKQEGKAFGDLLKQPVFMGRKIEIDFLGGMASLKLGSQEGSILVMPSDSHSGSMMRPKQLENPMTVRVKELSELARLFENNLITHEEYIKTKEQLLKNMDC